MRVTSPGLPPLAVSVLLAGCAPTHLADTRFHSAHTGHAASLAYDSSRERLTGGEVEAFADFHGVGAVAHVDYQRLREDLGAAGAASRNAAAAGLALRLSPIGLLTRKGRFGVLRFIDLQGDGGIAIGVAGSSGGVSERSEAYAGVGLELRGGFGKAAWFPGVTLRYRHTATGLSYGASDQVFFGLTWMSSYSAVFDLQD